MAEGYTDEELESIVASDCEMLFATVVRLQKERNAAMFHIGEVWMQRTRAVRERDEARRVAKGLAWALCGAEDDCDVCSDEDRELLRLARAYPEVES